MTKMKFSARFFKNLQMSEDEVIRIMADKSPRQERLDLLNEIIYKYYHYSPFQNIVLMKKPLNERTKPSVEFCIEEVISGRGGMCYVNNMFMKLFLEEIGFESHHVMATIGFIHGSHIITIVRNIVAQGDTYLVEVGVGYPVLAAVNLDFEVESPIIKHSYVTGKFVKVKDDDGKELIEWRHPKPPECPLRPPRDDNWYMFYWFPVEPKTIDCFDFPMTTIYTKSIGSPFHSNIWVNGFHNGRAVTIRNYLLSVEKESGGCIKTVLDEKTFEIELEKYFPKLVPFLKEALENLEESRTQSENQENL